MQVSPLLRRFHFWSAARGRLSRARRVFGFTAGIARGPAERYGQLAQQSTNCDSESAYR